MKTKQLDVLPMQGLSDGDVVNSITSSRLIDVTHDYLLTDRMSALMTALNNERNKEINRQMFDLKVKTVNKEPFKFSKLYISNKDAEFIFALGLIVSLSIGFWGIAILAKYENVLTKNLHTIITFALPITTPIIIPTLIVILVSFIAYSFSKSNKVKTIELGNENYLKKSNDVQRALLMAICGILIEQNVVKRINQEIYFYLSNDKTSLFSEQEVQYLTNTINNYEILVKQNFSQNEIHDVFKDELNYLQDTLNNSIKAIELNKHKVYLSSVLIKISGVTSHLDLNNVFFINKNNELSKIEDIVDKIAEKMKNAPNINLPQLDIQGLIKDKQVNVSELKDYLNHYYKEITRYIAKCMMR